MKLPVILASLLASTSAFAQAPGDYEASGDVVAAPGMVSPVVVVAPSAPVRRWSVGVGFGSLELAPHSSPESSTSFDIAALAVRYRASRHLELELTLGGGSETELDGMAYYDRTVTESVLALRYRFSPQRHWNWWLMAGIGALSIERPELDDEQRDKATKSTLQLGVGLEHRWERFALQFEVRAVGVKRDDEEFRADYPRSGGMTTTTYGSDGWAGGQFAFSGNYYF